MNLLMRLAWSAEMPALMAIRWRTVPLVASSILLVLEGLERHLPAYELLLEHLVQGAQAVLGRGPQDQLLLPSSMLESVPLKSKRVPASRLAWSTALRTSCMSTCETTSNVGIGDTLP